MDQLITRILGGDLNATSLLMLFILGILTKRFVPWWIHEEVISKLKEYEEKAPALLEEVTTLIDLMSRHESDVPTSITQKNREVADKQEALKDAIREKSVRRRTRTR